MESVRVTVRNEQVVVKLVKQMYHSRQFNKVDMTNWEKKAATDKTWDNAKIYFQGKYK